MTESKNLFILGDSYSTFEGKIPDDCETWYVSDYPDTRAGETDVCKYEQTWVHQFLKESGYHLVLNDSFSGTTICNTGYDGKDYKDISFIGRVDKLIKDSFFEKNNIDKIIVFGGTNDSWANAPIGEVKYESWSEKDLYCVLPAFGYLLHTLKETAPKAEILCVINTELKDEIAKGMKDTCAHFDIPYVALENISKTSGHPNILGMEQIKDQMVSFMKQNELF